MCAVCTMHVETRSTGFLDEPQNQGRRFISGLASKLIATVSPGLASKPLARVSRFGRQNWQLWFGDLGLKITVMVFWFGSQNQTGFGLSVAPQNQRWKDGAGHASRSGSLLRLEASHTRVSQSGLKTSGGTMVGGARDTITEVASGSS
jgi:hypothetical protein